QMTEISGALCSKSLRELWSVEHTLIRKKRRSCRRLTGNSFGLVNVRSAFASLDTNLSGSCGRCAIPARTPGTADPAIRPEAVRFRSWAARALVPPGLPELELPALLRQPELEHLPAAAVVVAAAFRRSVSAFARS